VRKHKAGVARARVTDFDVALDGVPLTHAPVDEMERVFSSSSTPSRAYTRQRLWRTGSTRGWGRCWRPSTSCLRAAAARPSVARVPLGRPRTHRTVWLMPHLWGTAPVTATRTLTAPSQATAAPAVPP